MSPTISTPCVSHASSPRVSGDEPLIDPTGVLNVEFSLREQG